MFERVAIVNRGEPAIRFIRAAREWSRERGGPLRTVALHTPQERRAMFVRSADEAVSIAPRAGGPANPYLDLEVLGDALRRARAEAAWVGWGFVAERPEFAELCSELGITFIGPPADVMRRLGDKISSKLLAEGAGVPVAAWSRGPVATVEEAWHHASRIGYPLVVKATAGGGGRGIRVVEVERELAAAFESARGEALRSFGDATVFLERRLDNARHVEVQIVADDHGSAWALGVRDCSVQRRRQKVLEESSSTVLDAPGEQSLCEAAVRLARTAGYRNAGTVEFLHQPQSGASAFLEVNTRLQVEHPVTEVTTGVDIVKLQIEIAAGGRLTGEPPEARGHAIEARLNAEDPERGFTPAPGLIEQLDLPSGPGIRVDTGLAAGDVIPAEYDSMLAKIIAAGRDRAEALARLGRALEETTVVIQGGTTNKSFLLALLDRPEVHDGTATTGWLDDVTAEQDGGVDLGQRRHADVALVAAAIEIAAEGEAHEQARFFAAAARGRAQAGRDMANRVEFRYAGVPHLLTVGRFGQGTYWIEDETTRTLVELERLRPHVNRITVGGSSHRVVSVDQGTDLLVEVDGVSHRVSRDDGGVVRAPAPGLVVSVPVEVDQVVEAGTIVAILEAMKMETAIVATASGRVREILVVGNVQVDAGAPLVRLEPLDGATTDPRGERVTLERFASPSRSSLAARDRALETLGSLRGALLGFDLDRAAVTDLLERYTSSRPEVTDTDRAVLDAELDLVEMFADLSELFRNRRVDDLEDVVDETRSAREHFLTYLRSLDVEREGLPDSFARKLRRALAHYTVHELDRTPALEEAVFRLFLAHEWAPDHLAVVRTVLGQIDRVASGDDPRLRAALDRLVVAAQVRFPDVGGLARAVRYRLVDEPLLAGQRAAAYERVRVVATALDGEPQDAERDALMSELVTCPYPLLTLLLDRVDAARPQPDPIVEAVLRRYYVIRDLRDVRPEVIDGHQIVLAQYGPTGRPHHVLTLATRWDRLALGAGQLAELARRSPAVEDCVLEVYLRADADLPGRDALATDVLAELNRAGLSGVRRASVSVGAPGREPCQLAFRNEDGGLHEDRIASGVHPMIAERLQLWRLSAFDVERMPSMPEVLLLHCTAKDNPTDERLVALAEVRDVTPVRDEVGAVVALPELEHVLSVCVAELHAARGQRFEWNRIVLYAWPAVEAPLDQLATVIQNLTPITQGVGLEQVIVQARLPQADGAVREVAVRVSNQPGAGVALRVTDPPTAPLLPRDDYTRKVLLARRRGTVYPYELIPLLTQPGGSFTELDLAEDGRLVPAERPLGANEAGIVVGLASTPVVAYPEGMTRVVLLGDPLRALGSLAEPECRRVIAALDLAEARQVPVEWFAVSSGARISMDSGTENMDWIASALRRIVEHTQRGGEINVVVAGINVGAQPYWNAEATMLMHTKGILVMTPDSAMVLTGKQALDYSGGVSAEDNFGIGGYERIMGPNGQAQYWAPDLASACRLLLAHYEHTYVAPGERFPRRVATSDPIDRDIRPYPHASEAGLATVGDIFSDAANPGRKKPFDIRTVLRAVSDQDHQLLERWADMRDAGTGVVVDAHLGGHPVTLIGIESRPLPRWGLLNADGPDQWSAGTLFPLSSKKVARGLNAASGSRPVVVLANLSGFDGSPESLRRIQLEYGAEIGRAVVNFDGPLVFCVISRYHGGAFVVFSGALNDHLQVLAVEGSYASVIGGAPAAAVVFAGEVNARTRDDSRVQAARARADQAEGPERVRLEAELAELQDTVRSEVLGAVAAEFDAVHSIERAREVGSVHDIVAASRLRPALIEAVERGIARCLP